MMALAPAVKKNKKSSKAQEVQHYRFARAIAMTRELMKDPDKVKYYKEKAKGSKSAWNVAMAECMKKIMEEEAKL